MEHRPVGRGRDAHRSDDALEPKPAQDGEALQRPPGTEPQARSPRNSRRGCVSGW